MLSVIFVTQSYRGHFSSWQKVTYMPVWQQYGRLWISLPQARPVELTYSWSGKHSILEDSKIEEQRGFMHALFFCCGTHVLCMFGKCYATPLSYITRWKRAHFKGENRRATWNIWPFALEEKVFPAALFLGGRVVREQDHEGDRDIRILGLGWVQRWKNIQ